MRQISDVTPLTVGASLLLVCSLSLLLARPSAQQKTSETGVQGATGRVDGRYLPNPQPTFDGIIKLNATRSKPAWPARIEPPKAASNILLITDDVGGVCLSGGIERWRRQVAR